MPRLSRCQVCGQEKQVRPSETTRKFCSYACYAIWRSKALVGKKNYNWKGGPLKKTCPHCQKKFSVPRMKQAVRFCSKACADQGGFRYSGESHPNYRPNARRRNRGGSHHKWVNAVISRDKAICQHCGAMDVELHAHHIKSYKDHPELRCDVANGITLCFSCHWKVHTAANEKAVNSVDTRQGNTEPSLQGNLLEGVTTRGRVCRRWVGQCGWCKQVISKRLSDVKGKTNLFCDKRCAGKHNASHRSAPMAVISSTNAAPEREDIV